MHFQPLTILSKEILADQTYLVKLQMEQDTAWLPGQFVVLQVAPKVFRSYSLVDIQSGGGVNGKPVMTLLLDTHVGGPASQFFESAQVGTPLNLIGKPLGKLTLRENARPKVFIATGTGLAPFVPMIKQALGGGVGGVSEKVSLFFGVRTLADAYSEKFFPEFLTMPPAVRTGGSTGRGVLPETTERFTLYSCISRPEGELPAGHYAGRVTALVPAIITDYRTTDFYLCGNPNMVDEMSRILVERGGEILPGGHGNIHVEKY